MNWYKVFALIGVMIMIVGLSLIIYGYMGVDDPQYFECVSKEGKWKQANDTNYKSTCNEVSNNYTVGGEIFTGALIGTVSGMIFIFCAIMYLAFKDEYKPRSYPIGPPQNQPPPSSIPQNNQSYLIQNPQRPSK